MPFAFEACWLRVFAESPSMSTLIGRSPWQPKATSEAKGILNFDLLHFRMLHIAARYQNCSQY